MPVSAKVRKYIDAARRGEFRFEDINLEMQSDRLLKGTGLSTEAQETARRRRLQPISLDSITNLPAPADLGHDPHDDARRALETLATRRERLVYSLYDQGKTPGQIATLLSITPSTVYETLGRVKRRLRDYMRRYEGWRQVMVSQITRRPVSVDSLEDEREITSALCTLVTRGWSIQPAGTDSDGDSCYRVNGRYLLREDQLITLATTGEVRTSAYGLVE